MTLEEAVRGLIALEKLEPPCRCCLPRAQELVAELALEEVLSEQMSMR